MNGHHTPGPDGGEITERPVEGRPVVDLHEPIYREMSEPRDGFEPPPTWLVFLCLAIMGFAGWYLGMYSGGFRADVYMRGNTRLAPLEHRELLKRLRFVLTVPRDQVDRAEFKCPLGRVSASEDLSEFVADMLADGPCSLGEMAAMPSLQTADPLMDCLETCKRRCCSIGACTGNVGRRRPSGPCRTMRKRNCQRRCATCGSTLRVDHSAHGGCCAGSDCCVRSPPRSSEGSPITSWSSDSVLSSS